jgi:alkylation response protein AidB-like acyl-CoA dehydrogenase
MIEFTDRLRGIRDNCREAAADLQSRALSIDANPGDMEQHFESPVYQMIRQSNTPVEYRESIPGSSLKLLDSKTVLEDIVGMVEMARGDMSAMFACPCPALAGVYVSLLGSPAQQEKFYTALHGGRTWTFFAMTEPGAGNDATAMTTRLEKDGSGGYLLYGAKRYIGHGARGGIGLVFGRTGRSSLSIRAALVEVPKAGPGWQAERLNMVGLRGAYLSELHFDGVPVPGDMLLGEHLPVTRRGIWGAIKTLNNMRIQISAAAVGTAIAMVDLVLEQRKNAPGGTLALARAEAARELVYQAAAQLDVDHERSYLASASKLGATRMAVETAHWAKAVIGPAGLLEHPLLEKWTRDVCAFEFMDGTSNIQRLHVARGYQKGDADV